jgi:Lrp/AsnC family transcriptional regulator
LKTFIDEKFMPIDDIDRRILRQMLAEPDLATADLAERAGVTAATCWRRIEKLRAEGVLRGTQAVIDWRKLGWEVEVSLRFTLDKTHPRAFDEFIAAARKVPEVIEIQSFLGQTDMRLNVIARDMAHYQEIYRTRILTLPHIADTDALMLISTIKDSAELPL